MPGDRSKLDTAEPAPMFSGVLSQKFQSMCGREHMGQSSQTNSPTCKAAVKWLNTTPHRFNCWGKCLWSHSWTYQSQHTKESHVSSNSVWLLKHGEKTRNTHPRCLLTGYWYRFIEALCGNWLFSCTLRTDHEAYTVYAAPFKELLFSCTM